MFFCAAALTAQEVQPDKIVIPDQTPNQPTQIANQPHQVASQLDQAPNQLVQADPNQAALQLVIAEPTYTPLDLKHKYLYSFNEMAGPTQWIGFAIHAGLDQASKSPTAWGSGMDSFGVRLASHFGRSFLRENIAFGVRAFDHEDPRYFRKGSGSGLKRTKSALFQTFMARRDDGGWMPAYSRFVADSTTPFLAQTWRPEKFSPGLGFRGGSMAIGMGFGANLWSEFAPDMKKMFKIPRHGGATQGAPPVANGAGAPAPLALSVP